MTIYVTVEHILSVNKHLKIMNKMGLNVDCILSKGLFVWYHLFPP